MKKLFLFLLLVLIACATVNEMSQEEEQQLAEHTQEVEEKNQGIDKEDILPDTNKRKWIAPNYADQTGIVGYNQDTFKVPEALKERVQFWVDIYSKYTTSQGVLHDSRYPHLVYIPVDFTHIDRDKSLSSRERYKAQKKFIDDKRDSVIAILEKLQTVTDPKQINREELRYWKMFESITDENKFIEASKKGRLRFQLGQRDRFIQGIYYSGRYIREIEEIFAEYKMPKELTRLPFVESSFNIRARSRVGASGVWQFMRSTGRLYMTVNATIDERNDPVIAAHAAAKLLRQNYKTLESWPLAVTAYNYGAAGIRRIVEKAGTKNLAEIYGTNPTSRFGFASESFYPSFLAAIEIEKNANKYFGDVKWADEVPYFETRIQRSLSFKDLKEFYGNDPKEIINLNPHFSNLIVRGSVRIPARTKVRVPLNEEQRFVTFLSTAPVKRARENLSGTTVSYRVEKGDTIYDISKQFRISIDSIMQANQDIDPRVIRPGQIIDIPQ